MAHGINFIAADLINFGDDYLVVCEFIARKL